MDIEKLIDLALSNINSDILKLKTEIDELKESLQKVNERLKEKEQPNDTKKRWLLGE